MPVRVKVQFLRGCLRLLHFYRRGKSEVKKSYPFYLATTEGKARHDNKCFRGQTSSHVSGFVTFIMLLTPPSAHVGLVRAIVLCPSNFHFFWLAKAIFYGRAVSDTGR